MGFGIPSSIGAKLANPDKTVVCFVGDGGFQMTNQEIGMITRIWFRCQNRTNQ